MLSNTIQLPTNIRSIIDQKKETMLICRDIDDALLTALCDYMVSNESTIDSLLFIDSQITKSGIKYLFEKYGARLVSLSMPDACLSDEDIQDLAFPKTLQSLCLRDNYLTANTVEKLKKLGIQNLDIEAQQVLETSDVSVSMETMPSLRFSSPPSSMLVNKQISQSLDNPEDSFLKYLSELSESERTQHLSNFFIGLKKQFNLSVKPDSTADTKARRMGGVF